MDVWVVLAGEFLGDSPTAAPAEEQATEQLFVCSETTGEISERQLRPAEGSLNWPAIT